MEVIIAVEVIITVMITAGTVRSAMVEIMSRAEVMTKGVTGLMANPRAAATRAAKRVAEMRKTLLVKTGGACSTPMMQISCPLGILQ
jgi:hypothetical protein